MEAIKFKTKVMENGIIQIPTLKKYENYEVEVSLILKANKKPQKDKNPIQTFFDKWCGFFSPVSTEDARYNALIEKHK